MKYYNIFILVIILLSITCLATADPIIIKASDVTLPSSTTQLAYITLQTAPNGYSGSNISISIADPTKAKFTSITFPTWAGMHSNSTFPTNDLFIKEVDTSRVIEDGSANVILATVSIEWIASGNSTTYNITTITSCDDDNGNIMDISPQYGNIYIGGVGGDIVLTRAAIDVTNKTATFVGTLATGFEDKVWFEYGMSPDTLNVATEKTGNITGDSAKTFTKTMPATVMFPGTTYYYRAVSKNNGNGSVLSFTIPVFTDAQYIPQVFEPEQTRYEQFVEADFNFSQMGTIISDAYSSVWGAYFYGILFIAIFGAYWLRQEDVTLPAFLYVILSATIYSYIPVDWHLFIWVSVAVAMAAMLYPLYRNLRNR